MFDLPDLIEWHEGMLLTPQHFQQFAARSELLTQFMFVQGGSYRWGVIDLSIDKDALNRGTLRILHLDAILPDGLLVLAGSERGIELTFDLQKAERTPARIFLAVPREASLYDLSDYSRYEGFSAHGELVADGISGGAPGPIPRLRARLRLVSGEADLAGMTALPLIEFDMQGTVSRQTDYIPPVLRITPGSPLANLCAPVQSLVREKATELARKLRPDAKNNDPASLQTVQWLVAALPPVEALLAGTETHPYALYLALCSMAGSVAFLSDARTPPIFSAYDHGNLRSSFQEVLAFIQLALSQGLIENWIGQPFRLRSEREPYFELQPSLEKVFGSDADFSSSYVGLMLRGPAEGMAEWGESCLLAREDAIADLETSRSQGAICERVDALEDLAPAPGTVLFRVKNESKWLDPRRKLVLKGARQETRMPETATLFIRKRTQSRKSS